MAAIPVYHPVASRCSRRKPHVPDVVSPNLSRNSTLGVETNFMFGLETFVPHVTVYMLFIHTPISLQAMRKFYVH